MTFNAKILIQSLAPKKTIKWTLIFLQVFAILCFFTSTTERDPFFHLLNMPPNVILAAPSATSSSGLVTPALKKDENQVFTWNEVYHYVCK